MKNKFKLLLATVLLCISNSIAFGQKNVDNTFIGYWTTDDSSIREVIFKDKNDELQMVLWDSSDGEEKLVLKLNLVDNTIKTTEKMPSTNWTTYNTYSIVDENSLKCVVDGDGDGAIIYMKRVK